MVRNGYQGHPKDQLRLIIVVIAPEYSNFCRILKTDIGWVVLPMFLGVISFTPYLEYPTYPICCGIPSKNTAIKRIPTAPLPFPLPTATVGIGHNYVLCCCFLRG